MKTRILGACLAAGAAVSAVFMAPSAVAAPQFDQAMVNAAAVQLGLSPARAAQRLDQEQRLSRTLADLQASGMPTDGAFFDSTGALVVTTSDAKRAKDAGLTPRAGVKGERALNDLSGRVQQAIGADKAQVQTWGPDVAIDRVVVTVEPTASDALVLRLSQMDGVVVETGSAKLVRNADVVPGRIMDLVPGTNCSLGFNGTRNGAKVLLTAGHCVEGNPDILDANGTHIGKGAGTRFPSVDMGIVKIDAEDTQRAYVDTRNGTTVRITGSSKAPVGTTICKAGNTTGWTCGKITHYNQSVQYSGESVTTTGLARSTVCTEGGDSGGAYISGNTAQGMTSGGPSNSECGYNQGANATGFYSFYQPVVDAANYYGVTLLTS
ncbi:peptidase S1 [Actinosynnema sp. ALI-1.44]|uniref:trypsin-like serine protease n=1 Tax=Actinosynnema sp. ALI-1.44 TaxID=1933779 RepID=UPI00097BCE50|nr:trypsin-like serine protease [Actinosynnema sp. ALI-1.44]ONI75073.1 peptidase S1 [Actinosynnema sp. ALI-1.44]